MLYDLALNVRNRSNINRIYIRSAHRNNSFSGSPVALRFSTMLLNPQGSRSDPLIDIKLSMDILDA